MPITPSEPEGVAGAGSASSAPDATANAPGTADAITQAVVAVLAQLHVLTAVWGVVNTVTPGPPTTVTLTPQGASAPGPNQVPVMGNFDPIVGQTVLAVSVGTDLWVLNSATGTGSADVGLIGYFTKTPPANWLLCNGSTFSAVTYPALYAFLGTNVLPDLRNKFIVGAGGIYGIGTTGGAATVILAMTNLPASPAPITATVSGSTGTASAPHVHNSVDPNHPSFLMVGVVGGNASWSTAAGIAQTVTTTGNNTTDHTHPVSLSVGANSANLGAGTAFSILPPYIALYACMRAG
jgi:microcystin-dependent protein